MATEQERNRGAGAYSSPGVDRKSDVSPAVIITSAPEVKFRHLDLDPPSFVYITREDALKVNLWNSAAGAQVLCNFRILRPDGVIVPNSFSIFPPNTRARTATIFGLTEGFLLSVQLFGQAGGILRGQCFAYVEICRPPSGTVIGYETLVSDYVTNGATIGWPGGRVQQSTEGPGFLHSVAVGNPAAGADWNVSVPTNARWKVICARMQLVTGAAVANRAVESNVDDGAASYAIGDGNLSVPASTTVNVSFMGGIPTIATNYTDVNVATPPGLWQPATHRYSSRTLGIQAADQFSLINLLVEEWIET